MSSRPDWNDDFGELVDCLAAAKVDFVIVGAHALAHHGIARSTGDLDIWIRPDTRNAAATVEALESFGAPLAAHGVGQEDFEREGTVYQLGLPPRRIDLLTSITGVAAEVGFASAVDALLGGRRVKVLAKAQLVANKRATGRPQDLDDVRRLESLPAEQS